jgi:hypothetical protein
MYWLVTHNSSLVKEKEAMNLEYWGESLPSKQAVAGSSVPVLPTFCYKQTVGFFVFNHPIEHLQD